MSRHDSLNSGVNNTMNATSSSRREIAIFWDFENVQLPSWAHPADASKAIVQAVTPHGRIVDRRLYFDMADPAKSHLWSALDSSGFDLVNTPKRNNQKETLDKKLIADVLTFAWDSAVRNDDCKPCVVLLTSDGDYAYTLSKLRDRGVMSIVMYGNDGSVANVLKTSADISLSLERDVLNPPATASSVPNPPATASSSGSNTKARLKPVNTLENCADYARVLCQAILHKLAVNNTHGDWMLGCKAACIFCEAVLREGNTGNTAPTTTTTTTSKTMKEDIKDLYRKARDFAYAEGWLEQGRKCLVGPNAGQIFDPSNATTSNSHREGSATTTTTTDSGPSIVLARDTNEWSKEDFMRVTPKGKSQVRRNVNDDKASTKIASASTTTRKGGTTLFLKDLPLNCRIQKLVKQLEQNYKVVVIKGYTTKADHVNVVFASIQLANEDMAERLYRMGAKSELKLFGRIVGVTYHRNFKPQMVAKEFFYERRASTVGTEEGKSITSNPRTADSDGTRLFFKNVPAGNITNLVGFLESTQNVTVLKARIDDALKHQQFCRTFVFAHVTVATAEQANRLIQASNTPDLQLNGRTMTVKYDRQEPLPSQSSWSDPTKYYERPRERFSSGGSQNKDVDHDVEVFMQVLREVSKAHLGDGWLDGGSIAKTFYDLVIHKEGMTTINMPADEQEQLKARLKAARAKAQGMEMIEVGRRLKAGSRRIRAVDWKHDASVYSGEIYIRLTCAVQPVPATVVSLSQDEETYSVISADSKLQKSFEADEGALNACKDETLLCRLLFELGVSSGTNGEDLAFIQWRAMVLVASHFQNLLLTVKKVTSQQAKDRFKKARAVGLSQGLIEIGQRDETSPANQIVEVSRQLSEDGSKTSKLSKDLHLRLTAGGVKKAERAPRLFPTVVEEPNRRSLNALLSNLSKDVDMLNLVKYLQSEQNIGIRFASLDPPVAELASAHVQVQTLKDAEKLFGFCKEERLHYDGKALCVSVDCEVPNWEYVHPRFLYKEKASNEGGPKEEDESHIGTSAEDHQGNYNIIRHSFENTDESIDSTNLLYGDNLAKLYSLGISEDQHSFHPLQGETSDVRAGDATNVSPSTEEVEDSQSKTTDLDLLWA
jgi:NYN domain